MEVTHNEKKYLVQTYIYRLKGNKLKKNILDRSRTAAS